MQPGYPGPGEDPYGQQPPYSDPYAQPQYPPSGQRPPVDPHGQPGQPAAGSGDPYPTPGPGYPAGQDPMADHGTPMGAPPPPQSNTFGLVGMILGIISIPGACCGPLGIIVGAAAVALGVLGIRKASAGQAGNRGQALAGVICGSIGVVFSIASTIFEIANFADFQTY
jgi:hypothetical protein